MMHTTASSDRPEAKVDEQKIEEFLKENPLIDNILGQPVREFIAYFKNWKELGREPMGDFELKSLLRHLLEFLKATVTFDYTVIKQDLDSFVDWATIATGNIYLFQVMLAFIIIIASAIAIMATLSIPGGLGFGVLGIAILVKCFPRMEIQPTPEFTKILNILIEKIAFLIDRPLIHFAKIVEMLNGINTVDFPWDVKQSYETTMKIFMYELRDSLPAEGLLGVQQNQFPIEEEFLKKLNQYTQKPEIETYKGPSNLSKRKEFYDDLIIKHKKYLIEIYQAIKQKIAINNFQSLQHDAISKKVMSLYCKLAASTYILNKLNSDGPISPDEIKKNVKLYFGKEVLNGRRYGFFSMSHIGTILDKMSMNFASINGLEDTKNEESPLGFLF